jgi:hypothetical protein
MSDKLRYIRQIADWITDENWQESPSNELLQDRADGDSTSAAMHPPSTMVSGQNQVKPSARRNSPVGFERRRAGRPVKRTSRRPHHQRLHLVDSQAKGGLSDAIEVARPDFREDDVLQVKYLLVKGLHQVSTLVTLIGSERRARIALLALVDRGELGCRSSSLAAQSWVSLRS